MFIELIVVSHALLQILSLTYVVPVAARRVQNVDVIHLQMVMGKIKKGRLVFQVQPFLRLSQDLNLGPTD